MKIKHIEIFKYIFKIFENLNKFFFLFCNKKTEFYIK